MNPESLLLIAGTITTIASVLAAVWALARSTVEEGAWVIKPLARKKLTITSLGEAAAKTVSAEAQVIEGLVGKRVDIGARKQLEEIAAARKAIERALELGSKLDLALEDSTDIGPGAAAAEERAEEPGEPPKQRARDTAQDDV